jgi:hypothetical protein
MADNLGVMGNFAYKTIGSLMLGTENVITMSIDAPAITAFYLLHVNHVSAIALCNKSEAIVATLSASDIRVTGKCYAELKYRDSIQMSFRV